MNWLDLVFIALVIGCGVAGAWLGLIRATFGVLGVVFGILIAGQMSADLGGLYAESISNEAIANVTAYGLIIVASLIAFRLLTIVVRRLVYMLFLGWVDKVAGLAMGLIAGAAISAAAITGLAGLTYKSDLIDRGFAVGVFQNKADAVEVKENLERTLIDSALVGVFLGVTDKLPANAVGFVPSNFMVALEMLEVRTDS